MLTYHMSNMATWDYRLVGLSILIAILGSFVALGLANKLKETQGFRQNLLFAATAAIMGLTIWAMHFVGMQASAIQIPIVYDVFLSVIYMLAAVIGTSIAFGLLNRQRFTRFHLIVGSIVMGLAIVSMHYLDMHAMQVQAHLYYDPFWFVFSILIAILASGGVLWAFYRPRVPSGGQTRSWALSRAVLMGVIISGVHYISIMSLLYAPLNEPASGVEMISTVGQYELSDVLLVMAVIFGFMLLLLTMQAAGERQQTVYHLRKAEARYRSLFSSNTVGVIVAKLDGCVLDANDAFLEMVGYSREALDAGKLRWDQLTPSEFREIDMRKVKDLYERGVTTDYEKQFVHRDGHRVDVWIGGTAILEGTTDTVVACLLDITDKKQVIQSLAESEARLRQMAESNLIGIAFWNIYGKIYDANEVFLSMVGYSRDAMLAGQVNWKDLTQPNEQVAHAEKVQLAIAGEPISPYETTFIHRDGHKIDALVGYAMLKGSPDCGYAFVLDISERKRVEAALAHSAQRFRFMAESMPQKVWTSLPDGRVDYVNENWLSFSGLKFEDLQHWGWVEVVHPDELEMTLQIWQRSIEEGLSFQMEHRLRRSDGKYRWHLSRGLAMRDETGKIIMWVGTNTDIDDIKKTEQALKEREERFRVMADTAPIMIWLGDEQGGLLYGNKCWSEFTGLTSEETLGVGWVQMIHPDDREAAYEGYLQAFQERRPYEAEWRLFRISDQTFRWVMCTGIPLTTANGEFAGYVGTMIDITDQKRINEELESRVVERTAQLQAVNKELEAFSYSVSHDLRAPLRTIDGFSQAILEDYSDRLDEDGQRYLQRVREGSQQMAQLIDDMLTLSRMTRGEVRKEEVDLSALARSVVAELQAQEPRRTVDFMIQDGLMVQADKRLIQAVLQNLIGNAWKFTSHQTVALIEFGSCEKNGEMVYYVKDNGAGFDMTYVDKLFGAFQRLHDTNEFPGTGIGLATVQRVIHRHGGEIWAESSLGKGAAFYFTLS